MAVELEIKLIQLHFLAYKKMHQHTQNSLAIITLQQQNLIPLGEVGYMDHTVYKSRLTIKISTNPPRFDLPQI